MTVNIKLHHLGSVSNTVKITNIDSAECKNTKATSVETKCSLSSSLINVKSIKEMLVTHNNGQDSFRIDTDYLVPGSLLSQGKDKIIHLEAHGSLNGNSVEYLSSVTIASGNRVDAIIPPSSCSNLELKESITTINIPFDTENLIGTIMANIIGLDSSEVVPCV